METVSFIGGGTRSVRGKQLTSHKSLTNFMTHNVLLSTPHYERGPTPNFSGDWH